MTIRKPVTSVQNKWYDAQKVSLVDLNVEQQHNTQYEGAIVQNFFGSGIMLETPEPITIFSSNPMALTTLQAALYASGDFDGIGLTPHLQPSDPSLGKQLAVELTGSMVFGRDAVKVAIIGLSFDGEMIMDRFEFHRNEVQTTYKHYAQVLTIIFNNFQGNGNCSKMLDGEVIVRECKPYELNRDALMVAQDVEPDIFWRDFRPYDCNKSIWEIIQDGIGSAYDADALDINITGRQPNRAIEPNDISTQIGQKFKAASNNIQKITLLLGAVGDYTAAVANRFNWSGDLIVSLYALQTTVDNPTDIIPELAIEYEPELRPIAELSYSQLELKNTGYVLTDVAQPVDFVFSNTVIGRAGGITSGRYYAVAIRRTGTTDVGTIFSEVGNDNLDDSRLTVFNGIWVDVVEEDLWFQVWSDTAKFADGQAYDLGNGIFSPRTTTDPATGSVIDNWERNYSFVTTAQGTVNTAIIQATIEESITEQDERNGNNVNSRQQYVPTFSFLTTANLNTLKETSEPLILGCMADINPKVTTTISGTQDLPGLARGDSFIIINPDADLISYKLIGRKLIPQIECGSYEYRIFKATLCTDGYGDVNGDGFITQADVTRASEIATNYNDINSLATQQAIIDGLVTTLELLRADVNGDGVVSVEDVELIQNFVDRSINGFPVGTSFTHLELIVQPAVGRWDGYFDCDGYFIGDGYSDCYDTRLIDPETVTESERFYYGNRIVPSINKENLIFEAMPYEPVSFNLEYVPFWQPWLLALTANTRNLPATFTYPDASSTLGNTCAGGDDLLFTCTEKDNESPTCNPGRNDFYVPGNLILGGEIIRANTDPVKIDFEIGIINLELPTSPFTETSFDIFKSFVMDRGDGLTNASYQSMKYSDCTTVQPEDLGDNKVKFNVSIQSFVPNLDGYTIEDGYGIIVDDIIGVYMDHSTGILKLTVKDLDENPLYKTLVTKIQIVIYLKKAGWNNPALTISSAEVYNLAIS